jgi:amino acid permease
MVLSARLFSQANFTENYGHNLELTTSWINIAVFSVNFHHFQSPVNKSCEKLTP